MNTQQLIQKASKIKLLALDVDGVLTDGSIIYLSSGEEIKSFNVKDGLGVVRVARLGLKTAIISVRQSKVVEIRAAELKFDHVHQGVKDKKIIIEELARHHQFDLSEIAYMGDDVVDLSALQVVGLASCPSDAVDEVLSVSHFVSSKPGGKGAVRELCELIIKAQSIDS